MDPKRLLIYTISIGVILILTITFWERNSNTMLDNCNLAMVNINTFGAEVKWENESNWEKLAIEQQYVSRLQALYNPLPLNRTEFFFISWTGVSVA